MAAADKIAQWRANRPNPNEWGGRGRNNGRKMSSWNVALEQYNRFNNGTAGAFAIPSRFSRDYDLVAELAQEIRTRGRPVTWEEMNFPDLATDIDRPVKPCPGGRTSSRGSLGTPSSLGSTVPYSGGSSYSTPSRSVARTASTVSQSRPASRSSTPSDQPVRRTLDFVDTSIPTFLPGQWNPYTGTYEGVPPRADRPQPLTYIPGGPVLGYLPRSNTSTSGGYNPQSGRFELPDSP